jgi:serpin B
MKTPKGLIKSLSYLIALCLMLTSVTSCSLGGEKVKAANLMNGINAVRIQGKAADNAFISSTADFSIELFKKAAKKDKNFLVSPTSVLLALSMTANGADGETLSQMEKVLGGGISIDDLNQYLYSYVNHLPSDKKSKLSIADSIWFRGDEGRLKVQQSFLQKNADYYGAEAYRASFDNQTLKDINAWVSRNTDGMIDSIIDEIPPDAVMYLINAVAFDAEWKSIYTKDMIQDGTFTSIKGEKQSGKFMASDEHTYLDDGKATGFIKDYAGENYSFAVLLPNEGVDINDYLSQLTGSSFMNIISNAKDEAVSAVLPKFSYDYSINLNDALISMGMPKAFNYDADFSKLGTSSNGNIYIGRVMHKTFIAVDEKGTKAGAATSVEMRDSAKLISHIVRLDRPFIYAIIDNSTGLPIFIGALMSLK